MGMIEGRLKLNITKDAVTITVPLSSLGVSLSDGDYPFYLSNNVLIFPFGSPPISFQPSSQYSDDEVSVLNKLLSYRFEDRIVGKISMSDSEKSVLAQLVKKGIVTVYSKGKYRSSPVYGVSDAVYSVLKRKSPPSSSVDSGASSSSDPVKPAKDVPDYLVVTSSGEASALSNKYADEIKAGLLLGIRDIKDKNYYIVSKKHYDLLSPQILSILESTPLGIDSLIEQLGVDPVLCKGVVLLMGEKGDIYSKNNKYYLA